MPEDRADLILHPVRWRIIQPLMGGEQLTPAQIGAALPDVAQATLYRQINKLVQGGILRVTRERQVRGTIERVYALNTAAVQLTQADLERAGREDHMRYFATFVASLLGDFSRYLQREQVDFLADGVGYRQAVFYLNDEEFREFAVSLNAAIAPYAENGPRQGRTPRLVSTIIMPVADDARLNNRQLEQKATEEAGPEK